MREPEKDTAPSYGLIHITRAYNRAEISFDEWLRLSRDWAECIIRQATEREQGRVDIKSSGSSTDEI